MSFSTDLERLLGAGRISRRTFLTGASALGLAAVAPATLTTASEAAVPKKGGRFRMALTGGSMSDTLNTATLDDVFDIHADYCLRNNLVEIDPDGKAIPELAESWDAEPGAAKWIFRLRRGVEFHNGKTMTPADVIYSINHHRGETSKSGAKALVEQIDDIRADGPDAVIFTLKGGNADFPYILNDYHLTVVPEGTEGAAWDDGVGTGGYALVTWEPGVRAFFKRYPNYWKPNRAHFDEIEMLAIDDTSARTNALKTGQVDFMNRIELKAVDLMKKLPGIQVIRTSGGFHYTLPMHVDVPPFDNNDVRLALKYAIDREQLIDMFLRGFGTIANDHPIPPTNPYHAAELPQRRYDPDKARYHLKRAGLEGHTFELHTSELGSLIDLAMLYQQSAAKAGVDIKLVRHPTDGYWSNVWLKQTFCTCYWAQRPTADTMLSVAYYGDAPWNDSHFHHARFDQQLIAARTELDPAKRHAMYAECQRILRDEGGTVIPFFKDYVDAASDKVAFGPLAGNMEIDGHHACERWWFA